MYFITYKLKWLTVTNLHPLCDVSANNEKYEAKQSASHSDTVNHTEVS